jgi:hypothetical protein
VYTLTLRRRPSYKHNAEWYICQVDHPHHHYHHNQDVMRGCVPLLPSPMERNPVNGLHSFGWYLAPRCLQESCLVDRLLNQALFAYYFQRFVVHPNWRFTFSESVCLSVQYSRAVSRFVSSDLFTSTQTWHQNHTIIRHPTFVIRVN